MPADARAGSIGARRNGTAHGLVIYFAANRTARTATLEIR